MASVRLMNVVATVLLVAGLALPFVVWSVLSANRGDPYEDGLGAWFGTFYFGIVPSLVLLTLAVPTFILAARERTRLERDRNRRFRP